MTCTCSEDNPLVRDYYRVEWPGGTTDIQVRELASAQYRVIDHCCEHSSPEGTGISALIPNYRSASQLAYWYATHLGEIAHVNKAAP